MTHDELRHKAMSVLKRPHHQIRKGEWASHRVGFNCSIVLSELVSAAGDIPDAIGWRYGHSVLIECKTSRADFFADAKKPQRQAGTGAGEERYFMVPRGLLKPEELPHAWGLLEVEGREVTMSVKCKPRKLDLAGHVAEKRLLLSTISRIRTREFLMIQRVEDPLSDDGENVA